MAQKEDNTVAIVSYISLLGWIIAIVLHNNKKTKLGAYHLRQTLGIFVIGIGIAIANTILMFIPYLGILFGIVFAVAGIGLLILWILGLISAVNGEQKPLPIIGEPIQNILKEAFE